MVDSTLSIFLGADEAEKLKRIEHFQKNLFPTTLKELNFTLLYADDKDLTAEILKNALDCFPTEGAKRRLVVIKRAHKLKKNLQTFLSDFLSKPLLRTVLVLDIPEVKDSENLVEEFVKRGAEVIRFKTEVNSNAFDLCRAVMSHQAETALMILTALLRYKEQQPKILGALFWQWERSFTQKRLSLDSYKKGLKAILEADKKLKSSSSAFAREALILETLVVKLSYLSR
jgi:DNA polymerase III delta subunit